MKEAKARLLSLRDERLPAMPAMLSSEAVDLLGAAVAGAGAGVLSAKPVQITWQPGRSLCVSYDAQIAWSRHQRTTERLVASTGKTVPEGAVVLARDDARVAVWRMAADPALPGLSIAMDPERARQLVNRLGAPDSPVTSRIRAYRPGQRAVVELNGKGLRLFIKVVPPAEVPALQERHEVMAAHLPVPRSHGWSSEYGLVVLQALPGDTLRSSLLDPKQRLPRPAQFSALLDQIPPFSNARPAPSPVALAAGYALMIRSVIPELGDRLERLIQLLGSAGDNSLPSTPVHGDLSEAQVLVRDGEIVGLLDIDTAGMGRRIDDWANFIGHLATWELSSVRQARPRVAAFARSILAWADAETGNPAGLRRGIAAVVIGLATGPFRAQTDTWPADTRTRITLAERWAAEAGEAMNKSHLTPTSRPSHLQE